MALLFLHPMSVRMQTVVIQTKGDASWNLWWMWWAGRTLRTGGPLFFTDLLMYPTGAPLHLSRPDLVSATLSIPLQAFLTLAGVYNVLTVAALTFSAFAMYLLARSVTSSRAGALVAGAVFAYMPLTSSSTNLGHLEWTNVGFIPLAVLGFMRIHEGGLLRVGFRAVPLALAMCVSWYQGVFLLMFGAFYVGYRVLSDRLWRAPRELLALLGRGTAWAAAGLVMVGPLLVPAVREARANPQAEVPLEWVSLNSAGPLDPFRPNSLNPMWEDIGDRRACSFGYAALALGTVGVVAAGRRSHVWLLALLVFYLLSLGPTLTLDEQEWALPYRLLYGLPLGDILRVPLRLLFLSGLSLAVLVGWGVGRLWERAGARGESWPQWALALILAVVLAEYWPGPRPVTPLAINPFYATLDREPGGALLELPRSLVSQAMYWQTAHGRPIVGGYFSRRRPEGRRNEEVPVLRQLWIGSELSLRELRAHDLIDQPALAQRAPETLDAYGIRHVVLHLAGRNGGRIEALEAALRDLFPAESVVWDDGDVRAYRVPEHAHREGLVAGFGRGWERPRRLSRDGQSYRVTSGEGVILVMLLDRSSRDVLFEARAAAVTGRFDVEVAVNGEPRARLSVARSPQETSLALRLAPGLNEIRLEWPRVSESEPAPPSGQLAIGSVRFVKMD